MQSVGAAGFASTTTTGMAAVGSGVGAAVGGLWPGENGGTNVNENPKKPTKDETTEHSADAGTVAAGTQATIGNVVAGSTFASM